MDFPDTHHCFLCGDKNPIGFKLKFKRIRGHDFRNHYSISVSSFDGVVHGGIVATFLDE
jgi:hypothetical protein